MIYLLDTNICIYVIRKRPSQVIKKLTSLSTSDVCISSITLAELEYGVEKSDKPEMNKEALEEFLLPLQIHSFNVPAARSYGRIRALLEKKGLLIGSLDLMIGAHALSLGSVVVTNNVREFSRIPNLTIENWVTD